MTTELSRSALTVVGTIRHAIDRERIDDALALRHARALVHEPLMGVSAGQAYEALIEALESDARLATWRDDPRAERPITEGTFRAHLRRVIDRMDGLRPWPTPLFRPLDPTIEWDQHASWRPVGRIRLLVPNVEDRIHTHLVPMAGTADRQVRVAVLRLRSGNDVALVGRWWSDTPEVTAVLTRDSRASTERLMAELTSGGHFAPEEYDAVE